MQGKICRFIDQHEDYYSHRMGGKKVSLAFDVIEVDVFDPANNSIKLKDKVNVGMTPTRQIRISDHIAKIVENSATSTTIATANRPKLPTPPSRRVFWPSRKRRRLIFTPPTQRNYTKPIPTATTQGQPRKRRTRKVWTEAEKEALRVGYRKFGRQWARIKEDNLDIFADRTNVQLKVC